MPTHKAFYQSKTFWTNLVGGLLTILALENVTVFIPTKYAPYIAAITAVLNVVFRSIQTPAQGGLTLTPPQQ